MLKKDCLNVNIDGNKKLLNNETTRFIIWNLPSIITCPYATELCMYSCYAKKAEKVYPTCSPSRQANFEISRQADFIGKMINTIEYYRQSKAFKNKKIVFRLHESGDFYNKEYAFKWLAIIRHFENDNNIIFMAYTKSIIYFDGVELPKNFVLRSSIWADTNEKNKELTIKNNLPIYTAVNKDFNFEKNNYTKCDCKDCANCGKCWDKNIKSIACIIH